MHGMALGLVLVAVVAVVAVVPSAPVAACSIAGIDVDFDGTARGVDGGGVAYRVDEVRQAGRVDEAGRALVPGPGETVVVRYDPPSTHIVEGRKYRVKGWSLAEVPESREAYEFHGDCGSGDGTTNLDGSLLAPTPIGGHWWSAPAAVGLAVVVVGGVTAIVIKAVRARRTWRYR
jgi:hypothetical protein